MSDFRTVPGFEEAWRPPVGRRRTPRAVLGVAAAGPETRARLGRLARRVPEVMVKVTGRTRTAAHLRAHLDYVSRKGELALEGPDGWPMSGRDEVRDVAEAWSAMALADSRRRANTPFSVGVVLSMPAGTDPYAVRDAARAFADQAFGGRFDYVFALHTDEPHPHVHVAVRALGYLGERLNPKKADLEAWRQIFAQELRARNVEAEATPRRARGVVRKAERTPVRKIRERHQAGAGEMGRTQQALLRSAALTAYGHEVDRRPWDAQAAARQARVRALYLAQARLMQGSVDQHDQALGRAVERFVREMPAPESQRLALARALRRQTERSRGDPGGSGHTRQR